MKVLMVLVLVMVLVMVMVLVLLFALRVGRTGWLTGLLLAQVAVFAGLWPILSTLGQPQPVLGLVANLFAIPWVSLVVMPRRVGSSDRFVQ